MILLQFTESCHRRFLQHLFQRGGCATAADKHAMILSHGCIKPQTIANDISIRNRLKGLSGPNQHIATDDHGVNTVGGHPHHLLI